MVKTKARYEGKFTWYGETHTLYRYASSEKQAKTLLLCALSQELKVHFCVVSATFDGSHDNYSIKKQGG